MISGIYAGHILKKGFFALSGRDRSGAELRALKICPKQQGIDTTTLAGRELFGAACAPAPWPRLREGRGS
jgi:hypothetical protein